MRRMIMPMTLATTSRNESKLKKIFSRCDRRRRYMAHTYVGPISLRPGERPIENRPHVSSPNSPASSVGAGSRIGDTRGNTFAGPPDAPENATLGDTGSRRGGRSLGGGL